MGDRNETGGVNTMEKAVKGSFGQGRQYKDQRDAMMDSIGESTAPVDRSKDRIADQRDSKSKHRVVKTTNTEKEAVFADKSTGGGSKKLKMNRLVWEALLYGGMNKTEIAREYGISRTTIYNHIRYGKMYEG